MEDHEVSPLETKAAKRRARMARKQRAQELANRRQHEAEELEVRAAGKRHRSRRRRVD